LDLFGQIRNQQKANQASYLASVTNRDAIVQSLIAQLVSVRLSIANINQQISLIKQTINSRKTYLDVIENRYKLGLETASALDVRLARENLSAAKSEFPTQQMLTQTVTFPFCLHQTA
jgi:outer membrane protein TolC